MTCGALADSTYLTQYQLTDDANKTILGNIWQLKWCHVVAKSGTFHLRIKKPINVMEIVSPSSSEYSHLRLGRIKIPRRRQSGMPPPSPLPAPPACFFDLFLKQRCPTVFEALICVLIWEIIDMKISKRKSTSRIAPAFKFCRVYKIIFSL